MALKDFRLIYTSRNFKTGLTDVTAKIRKDGVSVGAPVALTELTDGRYELLLTPLIITSYGGAGYYDFYINSASKNAPAIGGKRILENTNDDLEILLTALDGKIDAIDAIVDSLALDSASIKATVEDTNTEVKDPTTGLANIKALIDSVTNAVTNIQNVTRFSAPLPNPMVRPVTGTKKYKIPCYLYDTNGNMEDPDSNQIQLQVTDESGNSRDNLVTGFTAQPHYITRNAQGEYEFELDIADITALEQLNYKFTYAEGGSTLVHSNTSEIIEQATATGSALETTSQEILADTAAMQPQVADIQTQINSGLYGLAALKALLDTIDGNTDALESELSNATYGLSAIRTQIDLKASQSSINSMQSDVDEIKGAGFVEADDSLKAVSDRVYTGGQAI